MKFQNLSVKRLFGRVAMGLALSMSGITIALFLVTKQIAVLLTGGALLLCALVGIFVLMQAFGKRLSQFTADLCQTLDHMIAGNEAPQRRSDSETQLARIGHRLARLYQIMQENRRRVDEERQELQTLVSDISHQVKTPVSNLKMATDTLLEKPMTEAERTDFIRGIRSQTDKLDFLFQALVKTSRLETGVIQLDKKPGRLFDTVAQAMSGIVYAAEKKEIAVSMDCPEDLTVSHDSKWTSEALFNLLDNAVKYTPAGGKIAVSVVLWEMPENDREILIADVFANNQEAKSVIRLGEEIELETEEKAMIVTMVGTYDQTGSNNGTYGLDAASVMITEGLAGEMISSVENFDYTWVISAEPEAEEAVTAALESAADNAPSGLGLYTYAEELDFLTFQQTAIFGGLQGLSWMIFLFGVVNLVNMTLSNQLSRRRELCMMRAVGMTKGQLYQVLTAEGMFYVLFSTGIALAGGMPVAVLICRWMGETMMGQVLAYRFPTGQMLLYIGVLVALELLLSIWTIRKQEKNSLIEQMRAVE